MTIAPYAAFDRILWHKESQHSKSEMFLMIRPKMKELLLDFCVKV